MGTIAVKVNNVCAGESGTRRERMSKTGRRGKVRKGRWEEELGPIGGMHTGVYDYHALFEPTDRTTSDAECPQIAAYVRTR